MLCFPKDHRTGTIFSKQFPGVDPKSWYAKRAGVHSHQENCSPSLFLLKFEVVHLKKMSNFSLLAKVFREIYGYVSILGTCACMLTVFSKT